MKYKSTIKKIEKFIQKRTKNLEGCVIGLSGGIDSTTVAYLSVRALGKDKVYGLIMPYGKQDTKDAEEVAKVLKIEYDIINIKPIIEAFEKTARFYGERLTKGNLMARVRMCLLYGAANEKKLLVLGTTNKSEREIGYFTKHGDGAVDIEPIANLYKTRVRGLAEEVGVPEKIIRKKPSAELWEGQTDENELGFDYPTLDKALQGNTERIPKNIIEKIEHLKKNSEHKKKMPFQMGVEK